MAINEYHYNAYREGYFVHAKVWAENKEEAFQILASKNYDNINL